MRDCVRSSSSRWPQATYGGVKQLEIDERGKIGERLVVALLRKIGGRTVDYNENATDEDKHWDFICEGLRYEVKTATLGKDGITFQHESIYKTRLYDGLIFVDIAPNDIYISAFPKKGIVWKLLHSRKDSAFYKWDTHLRESRKWPVAQNRIETLEDFNRIFSEAESRIRELKSERKGDSEL